MGVGCNRDNCVVAPSSPPPPPFIAMALGILCSCTTTAEPMRWPLVFTVTSEAISRNFSHRYPFALVDKVLLHSPCLRAALCQ